jgi:ABC-type dipeptide/oligopeptide/nickel transport system ATPase subunit
MDVLVIEQNIRVACAVSDTVAIMLNGRINRLIDSTRWLQIKAYSKPCSVLDEIAKNRLDANLPEKQSGKSADKSQR